MWLLRQIPLVGIITLVLASCVEYSPYEVAPKEKDLNLKAIKEIQRRKPADTIKFLFIGDNQRFFHSTSEFVELVNNRHLDADFVLISGDLTDFGILNEFLGMHLLLEELHCPYIAVIGNHDLIYNGSKIFEEMYGPLDFYFDWGGYRFVGINTNSREYDFDGYVPDVNWLDHVLSDTDEYETGVVFSHVPPDNDDFDNDLKDDYVHTLSDHGKVLLQLNGHNHDFSVGEPYDDGVTYLNSFSVGKNKYVVIRMWKDGFTYEIDTF